MLWARNMKNNRIKLAPPLFIHLRILASLLVFVLLPLVTLVVLESVFILRGGVISYEMLVLGLCLLMLPGSVVGICFVILLSLQILFAIAPAYHMSPESVLSWVKSLTGLPIAYIVGIIVAVGMFAIISICVSSWIKQISDKRHKKYLIVWVCVLIIAIFVDRFVEPNIGRNFVTSTSLSASQVYRNSENQTDFSIDGQHSSSATSELFRSIERSEPLPNKLLLVVIESLGLGNDSIQALQYKDIIDGSLSMDKYSVTYRNIEFEGSTVPGEIRELCRRKTKQILMNISNEVSKTCLPHLLSSLGYTTTAYHGYTGGFFDRVKLYSELGFSESIFANELFWEKGLSDRCGFLLFKGVCDSQIAGLIKRHFGASDEKEFIYWLTLNGHQPLRGAPLRGKYLSCSEMTLKESRVCWTIQHAQVTIHGLIEIAESNDDLGIVIVGDHSPGGVQNTYRSDIVPSIVIWSKL